MKINEAITRCLDEIDRSDHTKRTYLLAMTTFVSYLTEVYQIDGETDASRITMAQRIGFPGWMAHKNVYAKSTMELYLSGIVPLYDLLAEEDLIVVTEKERVRYKKAKEKITKRHEKKLPKLPTPESVQKMLDAAKSRQVPSPRYERDEALILTLWSSGCRNEEITLLKVSDVNLLTRQLFVFGKGSQNRYVPISPSAAKAIQTYWDIRGWAAPDDPAFARHDKGTSKRHAHMTTTAIRNVVNEIRKLADVQKFTPHQFRHSFATVMLNKTGDISLVQHILGHANPSTTEQYGKVDQSRIQAPHEELFD